jgi:hypothetical protein
MPGGTRRASDAHRVGPARAALHNPRLWFSPGSMPVAVKKSGSQLLGGQDLKPLLWVV